MRAVRGSAGHGHSAGGCEMNRRHGAQRPVYRGIGVTGQRRACVAGVLAVVAGAAVAQAQLQRNWLVRYSAPPAGVITQDLPMGMAVDRAGAAYIAGRTMDQGASSQALLVKISPLGQLAWTATYSTPDGLRTTGEGRAVALAHNGDVLVTGLVAGLFGYGDVVLLRYNAADGSLIHASQVDVAYGDTGWCLAVDAQDNVYVGGGTTGDGSDFLVVKFNAAGQVQWSRSYDGSGLSPYSADFVRRIAVAPDGNVVVTGEAVQGTHFDYVTIKYNALDGAVLWTNIYNSGGIVDDYPSEIAIDGAGDVYVTGSAGTTTFRYATVKIDGATGAEVWSHTDLAGGSSSAWGLALGPDGGVYITGSSDPDGNHSNFNDNYYTVKRRATDGALEWQALYGGNAIGQYDICNAVAVTPSGRVFVGGRSATAPYTSDALVIEYDPATGAELGRTAIDCAAPELNEIQFMGLDGAERLVVAGLYQNSSTGNYDYFGAGFGSPAPCYANCDGSTTAPLLNVGDFTCFLNRFAAGDGYANCDGSTAAPVLNVGDFTCFLNRFAAGCS